MIIVTRGAPKKKLHIFLLKWSHSIKRSLDLPKYSIKFSK